MDIIGYDDIFGNSKIIKTHVAIDSKERDKKNNSKNKDYSDPNDYQIVINKYKTFKNVISVRIIEAMIPNTEFIINNNRKCLDILVGNTEHNIILTVGNYSFTSLATEIQTKINASISSSNNFVVTLNNTGPFKTTILENSGTPIQFTLLFQTGKNADCSIADILGYDKIDQESILDGVQQKAISDYSYHLNSTKYVDIKIDEIPDIGTTIDVKEDIKNQILKRVPLDVDFGKEKYGYFDDKNYNYFTPIELSKLTIQIFNDNGQIYDSNRIDNYIILQIVMLQDKAPDNVGFNSVPNNIHNINQPVIFNKMSTELNNFPTTIIEEDFNNNNNNIGGHNNIIEIDEKNTIHKIDGNNNVPEIDGNNTIDETDGNNTIDESKKTKISNLLNKTHKTNIPEAHDENVIIHEIIEKDNNIKDNIDFNFLLEVIENYKLVIFFGVIILILLILLKKK